MAGACLREGAGPGSGQVLTETAGRGCDQPDRRAAGLVDPSLAAGPVTMYVYVGMDIEEGERACHGVANSRGIPMTRRT